MSPERQAKIIAALIGCPDGQATAQRIAVILDWKETAASLYLGHLYFANVTDRELVSENGRQYRYWIRPVISPPVTRGRWQPEPHSSPECIRATVS